MKHAFNPVAFGIVITLVFVFAVGSISFGIKSATSVSSKTTAFGLKDIGELATQAGYFSNVQVINDQRELWGWGIPFTQSKCIFSYDGRVKAGLDFSAIEISVDERKKVVHVMFPPVRILSTEVDEDSLFVYDESQSIFTPLTLDKVKDSRIKLVEEVQNTALENGLLEAASTNAETLLKGMLRGTYDPEKYTYEFEHEPPELIQSSEDETTEEQIE